MNNNNSEWYHNQPFSYFLFPFFLFLLNRNAIKYEYEFGSHERYT